MSLRRILITGGAGFIGSHLADELLTHGYLVRVVDALVPQVHNQSERPPTYLSPDVEFVRGDVREASVLNRVLKGVDAVVHLAAAVGVGQSMYEIASYTSTNDLGTAVLLEALAGHSIQRLLVASSMSIYGEGLYRDVHGKEVSGRQRDQQQLLAGQWEPMDANGQPLIPVATPESKPPQATSIYALSKYVQERMCLIWGDAYRVPATAVRFFNAYGPRQALTNPYTGVLAIFASRYLSGQTPLIFEDGKQMRDFVNVHDIARACRLALESPNAGGHVFNIGSGQPISIRDVADEVGYVLNLRQRIEPSIVGRYRVGDVRHCFADISKAKSLLGYEPEVTFTAGLAELADWLIEQDHVDGGGVQQAKDELQKRGLMV